MTEAKDSPSDEINLALVIFAFKQVRKRDPFPGTELIGWLGLQKWEALKRGYTVSVAASGVRRAAKHHDPDEGKVRI